MSRRRGLPWRWCRCRCRLERLTQSQRQRRRRQRHGHTPPGCSTPTAREGRHRHHTCGHQRQGAPRYQRCQLADAGSPKPREAVDFPGVPTLAGAAAVVHNCRCRQTSCDCPALPELEVQRVRDDVHGGVGAVAGSERGQPDNVHTTPATNHSTASCIASTGASGQPNQFCNEMGEVDVYQTSALQASPRWGCGNKANGRTAADPTASNDPRSTPNAA